MEVFAAERMITHGQLPRYVIHDLAEAYPRELGLTFAFLLCWVAVHIEEHRESFRAGLRVKPVDIYRAVALLSADLLAIQTRSAVAATGSDLIEYWHDSGLGYFVDSNQQ